MVKNTHRDLVKDYAISSISGYWKIIFLDTGEEHLSRVGYKNDMILRFLCHGQSSIHIIKKGGLLEW